MASLDKKNVRYNILYILVYIVGIILIFQLFNLQIVNGESYREQSNTRLSRATTIKAARGSVLDRSGNEFAGVKTENNIEIYKTNISNDELNKSSINFKNYAFFKKNIKKALLFHNKYTFIINIY